MIFACYLASLVTIRKNVYLNGLHGKVAIVLFFLGVAGSFFIYTVFYGLLYKELI